MELTLLTRLVAERTGLAARGVENTLALLADGATIPFISRYRKEQTGGMNEVEIAQISLAKDRLEDIERRKQTIAGTIEAQEKMTPELKAKIDASWDATELEDLYLPYRPRRRTRAQAAREAGLEPLADMIWRRQRVDYAAEAIHYLNPEAKITTANEALAGARDIVAERVSEDQRTRGLVRGLFRRQAYIVSRLSKRELAADGQKFRDYFAWSEPLKRCSAHRLMAMRRGEAEGILRLSLSIDDDEAVSRITPRGADPQLAEAYADAYTRLLQPSIEGEFFRAARDRADEEAIRIFARNLEQLLMASPLGQKRVMAIDPGFRTGCKVVCLSAEGDLLYFEAIYPHPPRRERVAATRTIARLVETYHIEAIAIGNGTAGRETQEFVEHIDLPDGVDIYMVSEDGASIYSASEQAREEFPDKDVTVRGAVSIGRRLMDPMAELVKIDPSSIGVGQYQKDVNQTALGRQLAETVVSCVNRVGVNLNTASPYLLTYVSGLGPALARGIVRHRQEHGPFRSRRQLMDVPRLGAKAFEQAAGFLRVEGSEQPLDNSAVHPERYALVERMARDLGATVPQLMADKALREQIDPKRYVSPEVGLPTLTDILSELERPSRDPRKPIHTFAFDPTVHEPADLTIGQVLPGIVTNITAFGAFVDIGVHTKGLVHVSQLADHFVRDPNQVVTLHQEVRVKVTDVDLDRGRIALTMKGV